MATTTTKTAGARVSEEGIVETFHNDDDEVLDDAENGVAHNEKSFSLKTMEDGQVLLYSNSVNARKTRIPYPWLLFNEKIKVNSVFLRDPTAVPDAVVLLFGGRTY